VWFDAFFLTMFHLKRPSPAVTLPPSEFGAEPREAPASIAVSGGAAN
jgi:hypothetical protein